MLISINQFRTCAQRAQETGGTLRLDNAGDLKVKQPKWYGRIVSSLKERIFSGRTRTQNRNLLQQLEVSIQNEYNVNPANYMGSLANLGQGGGRRVSSFNIPREVLQVINSLPDDIEEEPAVYGRQAQPSGPRDPRLDDLSKTFHKIESRILKGALHSYDENLKNNTPVSKALSLDEFVAIYAYSVQYYSEMNSALRSTNQPDPHWHEIALKTQDAIVKMQDASLVTTQASHRGAGARRFENVQEGSVTSDAAFASTSTNIHTATQFASNKPQDQLLMHIFGHSGVPLKGVAAYENENEILYNAQTNFKVLLKATQPQFIGNPITRMVVEEEGGDPKAGLSGVADALIDKPLRNTSRPAEDNFRLYTEMLYQLAAGDSGAAILPDKNQYPPLADALTDLKK